MGRRTDRHTHRHGQSDGQNLESFIQRMTVLGRGPVFQPVLASLPYTQTYTYNNYTIIIFKNILTEAKTD